MKRQLFTISAIVIAAVSLSFCSESTAKSEDESTKEAYTETLVNNSEGKELLESKCMACHKIQDTQKTMLAPPFAHIKKKYNKVNASKENFIEAFASFAANPQEDDAMMFGALKQFKVMPNMGYDKAEMVKIANYVYDNEFPEPTWCNK